MSPSALDRACEMWAGLARVPVTFPPRGGVSVVASAESWLCPPQWAGIVVLRGAAIATVPDARLAAPLRAALLDQAGEVRVDLDRLRAGLAVADVLGPATLAYLDAGDFTPAHEGAPVERLPAGHPGVRALLAGVDGADADESGMEEISSAAFVVRDGQDVVAAAGYRSWPGAVAHLSVLTARHHRSRGLARAVASAAVADALDNGMVPQWRARPEPSRRVARALGFRELGSQVSVRIDL
ncbi:MULTISPECIES: GNAT family N-acetyltransferase [Streptosporangium]|uniref:GNAT superfamily N-acetyltransferase n=1 Tax=Streptosporangium brasiliense TaxID=47480 RepID=A0ABT9RH53_9ACTN|nr:GNAT family N-acetyltransferase [Streptosporangium brasiliense]MDP9868054.1 GNAT superfamily N-acetyltransferase [Streptosporangium brasiliense]